MAGQLICLSYYIRAPQKSSLTMKRNLGFLVFSLVFLLGACDTEKYVTKQGESNGYTYEYVTNDPLKVRIYTLENGLKVYLSQYSNEPRIQTSIAVKAGGKFDPADATGLAHYLEHIMFKGTDAFGTKDWEKEMIFLDSIESMYETYRKLTDSVERVNYYKRIDEVSSEAAKYAIANEYDKMVSEIGARGTNAYTTEDRTVYINDIPANQVENWLMLEANRFLKIVPRLFHTELEAVYEEKNRSLDNDYWKTYEAMNKAAFKKHPYGTQTVIGTIDHLKNPSITEIKKYFDRYYKPNNVAICMSGEIDYDKTIALIDKFFGAWQPNLDLKPWTSIAEDPIAAPIEIDVYGPDSEWINIGFRFNGRKSNDHDLLRLTDMILSNSMAGLIDLNLKQKQEVLDPYSYVQTNNDFSLHIFNAKPRQGQTLEQVQNKLLEQVELIKTGQFEDWLVEAVINDLKTNSIRQNENNWARSSSMVLAFSNELDWKTNVASLDDLKKYSKQNIVDFANANYKDNYIVIKKRTGKDPNKQKVDKPSITKVPLNKEDVSPFHATLLSNKVEKLKPVFLDYERDIKRLAINKGVEVFYNKNTENDLFTLYYLSDIGTNNDPRMKAAVEYLEYVGTNDMSSEEIKKEFYKLGSNFGVSAGEDRTYVYLQGLTENMDASIVLFENLLANCKADDEALAKMIDGTFKTRDDSKLDKGTILWEGLLNYGLYGPQSPFTNVLTNKELRALKGEELIDIIKQFTKNEHRVLYYGAADENSLVASLNQNHILPDQLTPVPSPVVYDIKDMNNQSVYWSHYDMVQEEIIFLSKGEKYDPMRTPETRLFNEYFGGSMASPVFQELREAQGLAYSAFATYASASQREENDHFFAYIGTQADKQPEAMKAMMGLIQDFPKSENGFDVARNSLLSKIESERITKTSVLFSYESAKRRGVNYDLRKDVYEKAKNMTLEDLEKFQNDYIKGRKFNVVLVGDRSKINMKELAKYGQVQEISLDELFGYERPERVVVEKPN